MPSLEGKVALITGAKGGLGSFVTQTFLNEGASVAGASRSIRDEDFPHARFTAFAAELSDSSAAEALARAVVERFGRIDVLVHLIGAFAMGSDPNTLEQMLTVNLRAALMVAEAVLPVMRKQRCGRIVAIGSRAALEKNAGAGAYSASKAALAALMRAIAAENKEFGITANVVMPGTMDTPANRRSQPQADFTKWVQPAHVAGVIVSVVSDAWVPVSGALIPAYAGEL